MQSHGLSEPSMAAAHQVGSRRRERIVQQLFLLPAIATFSSSSATRWSRTLSWGFKIIP